MSQQVELSGAANPAEDFLIPSYQPEEVATSNRPAAASNGASAIQVQPSNDDPSAVRTEPQSGLTEPRQMAAGSVGYHVQSEQLTWEDNGSPATYTTNSPPSATCTKKRKQGLYVAVVAAILVPIVIIILVWINKDNTCEDPGIPKDGRRLGSSFYHGRKVSYNCNQGFKLVGSRVITCMDVGMWTYSAPICQIVACSGGPPLPYQGVYNRSIHGYHYGGSVFYNCAEGYFLSGSNSTTCGADGRWSKSQSSCSPVDCGDPGTPDHGRRHVFGFKYRDTVRYTCNFGYRNSGDRVRTCSSSGRWDGRPANCTVIPCPALTAPANGALNVSKVTQTVRYTCNTGYRLIGASSRRCYNSHWTGTAPTCRFTSCGSPPVPRNGRIVGNTFTYGQSVSHQCYSGYRLVGNRYRTCIGWGYWNGTTPKCIDIPDLSTQVRLRGGSNSSGRVEVRHNGIWRGVCDDLWDDRDAVVVCRMLGYNRGTVARPRNNYRFGYASSSNFWLDDVMCSGSETNIAECEHGGWGNHNCARVEAATVICRGNKSCGHPPTPINGEVIGSRFTTGQTVSYRCNTDYNLVGKSNRTCDSSGSWSGIAPRCLHIPSVVRLVGGTSSSGRVEVRHNGAWSAICDDSWSVEEAKVVCSMLGFGGGVPLPGNYPRFGNTSSFWLDELRCTGSESNLDLCSHHAWGRHNCYSNEAAKVICYSPVRLTGDNNSSGLVEVQHNGKWAGICDEDWDDQDAEVICRMNGYRYGRTLNNSDERFGQNAGGLFWLDQVNCAGDESYIDNCAHNEWGNASCPTTKGAKVECSNSHPDNAKVRLTGGNQSSGLVEVFHHGSWGGMCDRHWDCTDASVFCRMLHFYRGGTSLKGKNSTFSHDSISHMWLDEVNCKGNESSIMACEHAGWNQTNCSTGDAAGAICTGPKRIVKPILEMVISRYGSTIKRILALPGGEVLVAYHLNGTYSKWRVVKLDKDGQTREQLYSCNYNCEWVTALQMFNNTIYIVHDNGKVTKVRENQVVGTFHIPGVDSVQNTAAYMSPKEDHDVLLLVDTTREYVFTYNVSSHQKEVKISGLNGVLSVCAGFDGGQIVYVVCEEDANKITLYDSNWDLTASFGELGIKDGQFGESSSAIFSPEGTVFVADYYNHRVSEFTMKGQFIRHPITAANDTLHPFALSFFKSYLWVVQSSVLRRYKAYETGF